MPMTLFRAAFLASLAILPPLSLLGLPVATVILTIDAILAAIVLAPELRSWPRQPRRPGPVVLAILAIPALGLVSALWSILPGESAMRALKLLVLAGAGLLVVRAAAGPARPARTHLVLAIVLGLAAAAALALTDRVVLFGVMDDLEPGFAPRRGFYSRGATVVLLFAWLAVLGLTLTGRMALAAAAFAAVGLLVALKFHSGAAAAVWALSGVVYLAWVATRGRLRPGFAVALGLACFAAPLVVSALPMPDAQHAARRALPGSWSHRIVIWHFAADRIAERPILGWGLDASRKIPGGRETIPWQMDPDPTDPGDRMSTVQVLPLHPHSLALQLWLELGLPGALALAVLAFLLVQRAGNGESAIVGGAPVALTYAAFAIANVSYGAWQTWWLATLLLVAAGAISLTRADPHPVV